MVVIHEAVSDDYRVSGKWWSGGGVYGRYLRRGEGGGGWLLGLCKQS